MTSQGPSSRKPRPDISALREQAGLAPGRPRVVVQETVEGETPLRAWVLPGVVLAGSLVWRLMQGGDGLGVTLAIIEAILATMLATAAFVVAAKVVDHEITNWPALPLRIAALVVLSLAAAHFVAAFDEDPTSANGKVIALHLVVIVWFFGILTLFKIDLLDALACTLAGGVAQMVGMGILAGATAHGVLLFN